MTILLFPLVLLVGVFSIAAFAAGVLVGLHRSQRVASTVAAVMVDTVRVIERPEWQPLCDVCATPANPVRTHDGKHRCAAHKNVSATA